MKYELLYFINLNQKQCVEISMRLCLPLLIYCISGGQGLKITH